MPPRRFRFYFVALLLCGAAFALTTDGKDATAGKEGDAGRYSSARHLRLLRSQKTKNRHEDGADSDGDIDVAIANAESAAKGASRRAGAAVVTIKNVRAEAGRLGRDAQGAAKMVAGLQSNVQEHGEAFTKLKRCTDFATGAAKRLAAEALEMEKKVNKVLNHVEEIGYFIEEIKLTKKVLEKRVTAYNANMQAEIAYFEGEQAERDADALQSDMQKALATHGSCEPKLDAAGSLAKAVRAEQCVTALAAKVGQHEAEAKAQWLSAAAKTEKAGKTKETSQLLEAAKSHTAAASQERNEVRGAAANASRHKTQCEAAFDAAMQDGVDATAVMDSAAEAWRAAGAAETECAKTQAAERKTSTALAQLNAVLQQLREHVWDDMARKAEKATTNQASAAGKTASGGANKDAAAVHAAPCFVLPLVAGALLLLALR